MSSFAALQLKHFITVFPIGTHSRPNMTLLKICQGKSRVSIFTNYVELDYQILHVKFQDHMTLCSREEGVIRFTNYRHGGHSVNVTKTIFYTFMSLPFPRRLTCIFALIGQAVSEKQQPLWSMYFQNHKSSVRLVIYCLNDFVTISPI